MASLNSNMGSREKAVFVAQQLHFARNLAGNDPKLRNRAMKKLRKYFLARSSGNFRFTHDDFMRLWKGLFYCMWMSDKPLIQEELAEEISQLVHCFQCEDSALMFIRSFFDTLTIEWYGIDYHRLDKFQMFVRRFLRQCLVHCKNVKWKQSMVSGLCDVFESTILSSECISECSDLSLVMHFVDIFVDELAKVGAGKLPKDKLLEFLKPFISNLMEQEDSRLQKIILDRIFHCLIRQSPEGLEYEEKFEAWKRAGFPGKSWKEMVFVGKADKRSGVKIKHLDPRAGKVNVYLPHLAFDAKSVAELLREYAEKSSKVHCQKFILKIARKFQDLAENNYPLAENISKTVRASRKYRFSKEKFQDAVEDLMDFEEELERESREIKNKTKRKKDSSDHSLKNPKKMKLETVKTSKNIKTSGSFVLNNAQKTVTKTDNTLSPLVLNDVDDDSEISLLEEHEDHTQFENGALEEKGQSSRVKNGECGKENEVKNAYLMKLRRKKKLQNISSWSVTDISSSKVKVSEPQVKCEDDKKDVMKEVDGKEDEMKEVDGKEDGMKEVDGKEDEMKEEEDGKNDEMKEVVDGKTDIMKVELDGKTELSKCFEDLSSLDNSLAHHNKEINEENVTQENLETENKKAGTTTPLRRSWRVSKIQSIGENMEKEKISSPTQDTFTPRQRRSCVPNEEKEDEKKNEEESLNENETSPMSIRRQVIRAKRRLSKVPDREIPGLITETPKSPENLEIAVLECSNDSPINEALGIVSDKNSTFEDSFAFPRKTLRSPGKRSPRRRTPASAKKVNIALQMNRSQGVQEYKDAVMQSPSVPHDANKKPFKGVLKRTSIGSPINPFYVPPKGIH